MNRDHLMPEDTGFSGELEGLNTKWRCTKKGCGRDCTLVEDKGWPALKVSSCCNRIAYRVDDEEEIEPEEPELTAAEVIAREATSAAQRGDLALADDLLAAALKVWHQQQRRAA